MQLFEVNVFVFLIKMYDRGGEVVEQRKGRNSKWKKLLCRRLCKKFYNDCYIFKSEKNLFQVKILFCCFLFLIGIVVQMWVSFVVIYIIISIIYFFLQKCIMRKKVINLFDVEVKFYFFQLCIYKYFLYKEYLLIVYYGRKVFRRNLDILYFRQVCLIRLCIVFMWK